MTSELAHSEAITTALSSDGPLVNGDQERNTTSHENSGAFDENAELSKSELNAHPSGPTPVEGVAPGITGVAGFIPKTAQTSHPTPPPDEPLITSEADVDMTRPAADETSQEATTEPMEDAAAPVSSSTESSLVRPREDDADDADEPVAKRSRVEIDSNVDASMADVPPSATSEFKASGAVDESVTKIDASPVDKIATSSTTSTAAGQAQISSDLPGTSDESSAPPSKPKTETPGDLETKPAMEAQPVGNTPAKSALGSTNAATPSRPAYSKASITIAQSRFLQEKTKNLKKTKNSQAFLLPVDPVALNIPQYPEIVKHPMDLTTMEHKLKSNKYTSVQEYADDFFLIIDNAQIFNGPAHPVSQAGQSMEAYFRKMMESVPSSDAAPPKPQAKKASPKPPAPAQRRESRSVIQTTAPAPGASTVSTGAGEAFALQPDGTPQIRRDSTINRPARAIKPPPARELTYSKPKRKEHQLELKFCEHVLNEVRSPRYATMNQVFLAPVDPVALNIPHYRQIVKHPMDLSTMAQKLKQGQYGKATEFRKDFELMISNCLAFNPVGNPVRDLGIQFQREFEAIWKTKEKWERARKADSQRATSVSADEESAEEEEEEDEEEIVVSADPQGTIRALQKQLVEMQNALAGLGKPVKQSKPKSKSGVKSSSKKLGSSSTSTKQKITTKAKPPKKVKQVTYEEKQEISEAVGKMDGPQVEELTRIITSNVKKYADQEEMELEIDDLPNDVQAMLLKYVRGIFGNPTRGARAASPDDIAAFDDDDFEPERSNRKGGGSSKRKKHKPMGKKEQQDAIDTLQRKLSQFNGTGGSASQSPHNYAVQDDTSGDEESEESEEE